MPSAIGSNGSNGFAPQQTQIALSTSFSDIQLLSNFDALELQGYVAINATPNYRASFKLSIIKNGAGVYEIAASDIAGDDYLGSPIMSFQILGNYLQCKMDVASPTSGYVKFNIDTPTPALVGTSPLSIEGSNIVSTVPVSRLPFDYEEYTMSVVGGTSDFTAGSIKIVKFGNMVTITSPDKFYHGSLQAPTSGDILIPAQFRPTSLIVSCLYSYSAVQNSVVESSGKISFGYYAADGSLANRTNSNIAFNITYNIA